MPAPNVAQPDNEGCLLITATTLRSHAAALTTLRSQRSVQRYLQFRRYSKTHITHATLLPALHSNPISENIPNEGS